jgi:NADH-quinone oxidoreductase subunit J
MSAGVLLFAVCSIMCVLGALAVVLAKNPIRGAVGLLTTIVGIAGLFLRLNAQFLAAIQLIVYAGAVVVLFVFVVMLLGPNAGVSASHSTRSKISRVIAGSLVGLLGLGALVLLAQAGVAPGAKPQVFPPADPSHGSIEAVGGLLFTKGLVPFELATALLIVAVIGAIAVARTKHVKTAKKPVTNPTLRMFHGPLHPRDAGRPLTRETLGGEPLGLSASSKEQA